MILLCRAQCAELGVTHDTHQIRKAKGKIPSANHYPIHCDCSLCLRATNWAWWKLQTVVNTMLFNRFKNEAWVEKAGSPHEGKTANHVETICLASRSESLLSTCVCKRIRLKGKEQTSPTRPANSNQQHGHGQSQRWQASSPSTRSHPPPKTFHPTTRSRAGLLHFGSRAVLPWPSSATALRRAWAAQARTTTRPTTANLQVDPPKTLHKE